MYVYSNLFSFKTPTQLLLARTNFHSPYLFFSKLISIAIFFLIIFCIVIFSIFLLHRHHLRCSRRITHRHLDPLRPPFQHRRLLLHCTSTIIQRRHCPHRPILPLHAYSTLPQQRFIRSYFRYHFQSLCFRSISTSLRYNPTFTRLRPLLPQHVSRFHFTAFAW